MPHRDDIGVFVADRRVEVIGHRRRIATRRCTSRSQPASVSPATRCVVLGLPEPLQHHSSARAFLVGRGVEQAVQVDDEIACLGIVDGRLGLRLPGCLGRGVVRKDADDIERREVLELGAVDRAELAPEDEVKQLLVAVRHGEVSCGMIVPRRLARRGRRAAACARPAASRGAGDAPGPADCRRWGSHRNAEAAAGLLHDDVSRRNIPVMGARLGEGDIGPAFREVGKAEREGGEAWPALERAQTVA